MNRVWTWMPCFLTALSSIKGISLFFCGYIRFGKSNFRANCCQGCQGTALMLPSSSHWHCHHAVEAKEAKAIVAGIHQRSCVLSENTSWYLYIYFLCSFPKFLLLGIVENNYQLVGYWVGSILISGCRNTFAGKPESSHPKKDNPSHSFSLWFGEVCHGRNYLLSKSLP